MKRIIKGAPWNLVDTRRDNVKNNEVLDGVMDHYLAAYYIHALADAMNKENRNDWILVTRSRKGT